MPPRVRPSSPVLPPHPRRGRPTLAGSQAPDELTRASHAAIRARLLAALVAERGHRTRAATALGCTVRTVAAWIERLGLVGELDRMAREGGWLEGQDPATRALRGRAEGRG